MNGIKIQFLHNKLQLTHRASIMLLVELACLGCGGSLATSKPERAGLKRLTQALVLLDADSESAVE